MRKEDGSVVVPRGFVGGGNVQGVVAKEPKKASILRAVSRVDKALLANQKRRNAEEGGGEREGKRRRSASSNSK